MSLQRLRAETGPLHRDLENKLRLFETVTTSDSYVQHLKRLYQWLLPLEEKITPFATQLPIEWSKRCKSDFIAIDLRSMGEAPPSRQRDLPTPQCQSLAAAVGILYVLEGSSLGAQVITRHYNKTLGLTPENGLRYFHGHGEKTGMMWTSFLQVLNDYFARHPQHADEVIYSACATFQSYGEFVPQKAEEPTA